MGDECRWECQGSRMTKQGWKGRQQQDFSSLWAQHTSKAALFMVKWRKAIKKILKIQKVLDFWHKDLTCLARSRSCVSSKGPWAAKKPISPSSERGLCSGTAWERGEIQPGQMVGRKHLPTAAGSSKKKNNKSKEEQPKHNHIQLWDRENRDLQPGQEREVGTAQFSPFGQRQWAEKSPWGDFWSFCTLENQEKISTRNWLLARNCCALNFDWKKTPKTYQDFSNQLKEIDS